MATQLLRYDPLTDTHWCYQHDPDPTRAEQRRLAATRGGLATAKRFRRGIDADQLGQLESADDAMRWSRILATEVATGGLTPAQANAALRAVTSFTQARDLKLRESRLADLEAEVQRLRTMRRAQ